MDYALTTRIYDSSQDHFDAFQVINKRPVSTKSRREADAFFLAT